MHDIRWIRDNADAFKAGLAARNMEPLAVEELVAQVFTLDDERREIIGAVQKGQEERNRLSKEIGQAIARKDAAGAEALKARVADLKTEMDGAGALETAAIAKLDECLAAIPNLPLADVPPGRDEHDNVELRTWGEKRAFAFQPKEHDAIGEALGLMDFEAASRLSGARFVVTKGALARLERALGAFMLDLHTGEHGYMEVNPPLLVRDNAMFGTAQLPKFRDDQFAASAGREGADQFWLIPTAEVPLTNLVREQIVDAAVLPLRYTASTPCFRAEAGAAGRDTRGMIRQHQFTKVELVSIVHPDESEAEHQRLTRCAETVLERLELPYRTMLLCTGDMGFAARKTYDIEVWLPGQGRYREISSCSQCGDFQARRMNARVRDGKQIRFVHTLNGSGLAVGRTLVAVLENYQNADGSVTIPEVLRPYMGGMASIAAAV